MIGITRLTEVTSALQHLAWPLIVAVLLWRLFPTLRRLLDARGFSVRLGQFEFTAQEWSDDVLRSTAEIHESIGALESDVAALRENVDKTDAVAQPRQSLAIPVPRDVLWVDDVPSRNRFEAAQLELLGAKVTQVTSTPLALERLASTYIDVLITNLGRNEQGAYDPEAGVKLLKAARAAGFTKEAIVFDPRAETIGDQLTRSGADAVASSPPRLHAMFTGAGHR